MQQQRETRRNAVVHTKQRSIAALHSWPCNIQNMRPASPWPTWFTRTSMDTESAMANDADCTNATSKAKTRKNRGSSASVPLSMQGCVANAARKMVFVKRKLAHFDELSAVDGLMASITYAGGFGHRSQMRPPQAGLIALRAKRLTGRFRNGRPAGC